MITRGALNTTPRAWLGQVTLLPLDISCEAPDVTLDEHVAARWTQKAQEARRSAAAEPELEDSTVVGLSPLHRQDDGFLQVWCILPARAAPAGAGALHSHAFAWPRLVVATGTR